MPRQSAVIKLLMEKTQELVEVALGDRVGPQGPPGDIASTPPSGKYKVVNLYVDPVTGKLFVEYDDTPV